ncbi:MAG: tyrosine-type recombinase/integrase [Rhodospirillales bacterium]|nr:tyrosine-type recombinase/integrase [Rhodospirillales bacterium]
MVSAVEIVAAAKCGIAAARQMSGWRRVQHFRDGLALLLAVWVPERRRALVGISLRDIDMEASTIRFSPDRMKTGESRIRLLPSELAPLLAEYITLRGVQTHDALLIGKGGRPLGGAAFYAAACRTTERYMGRRLPPHFFRNGVAIALVEADPNRPDLAQVALGHRSATTTNHYTESATSIAACRHLTSSISQAGSKARQRL